MFLAHGMHSMIHQVVYLLPVDNSCVKLEPRPSECGCLFFALTGLLDRPKKICIPSLDAFVFNMPTTLDGWPKRTEVRAKQQEHLLVRGFPWSDFCVFSTASTTLPSIRPLASAIVCTHALFMCVLVEYRTQLYPGRAEVEERPCGVRPASSGRSCKVHLRLGEGHGGAPVVGNIVLFIPAHCFQRGEPGGTGPGNPAVGVS